LQLLPYEHSFNEPLGLLSDCHRRVERFLEILEKVGQDAPADNLPPKFQEGLKTALDYFRDAAPKHTEDEEDSLFPRIIHSTQAASIIERLESDHESAGPFHETVEDLGRTWLAQGRLGSEQRAEFMSCVESLRNLYQDHIRVEDEELFPLAATLLDEPSLEKIGEEMAARRGLDKPE
jgi:hemerythrin-like domain-containing protein